MIASQIDRFGVPRTYLMRFWVVAGIVALVFGIALYLVEPSPRELDGLAFNEMTKAAIDMRLNEAGLVLNLTVVILGALLALVFASPREFRITARDTPEWVMVSVAVVLLFLSIACHWRYLSTVEACYLIGGVDSSEQLLKSQGGYVPDVFDPKVTRMLLGQLFFFFFGLVVGACGLLSAHRLKPDGGDVATPSPVP